LMMSLFPFWTIDDNNQ